MLSIGEFARQGGVSVRMLRHYDALGLLAPHDVDPSTGHRSYTAGQLPRLNRIRTLSPLGFPLRQVRAIVDDEVAASDLPGVLSLRRDELRARIAADTARLVSVESRLRALADGATSTHDRAHPPFTIRTLEPVRLAELTAVADLADAGTLVPGLLARLDRHLADAGVAATGPRTSYQRPLGGRRVQVHAGVVVAEDADLPADVTETRLPAVAEAACLVVTGAVEDADADARTLAWWLHDNGYRYRLNEPARQVHLALPRRPGARGGRAAAAGRTGALRMHTTSPTCTAPRQKPFDGQAEEGGRSAHSRLVHRRSPRRPGCCCRCWDRDWRGSSAASPTVRTPTSAWGCSCWARWCS